MLLSRRTRVQPSGPVIEPPGPRRAVTTPISTSPTIPPGWATVSDEARDVRAVALALTVIEPPPADGPKSGSSSTNTPKAGPADTTKSAVPIRAMRAANLCRGRLPNMPSPSAQRCGR
jgi:hypothetical protein